MKSPNNFEFIKSISSATARTLSINNNITVAFYNDTEVVETKNQNEIGINLGNIKTKDSIRGKIDFMCFCESMF